MSSWGFLNFDDQAILLKKGQQLFDQGALVQRMHQVVSGRVKLIRQTADGDDVVLHIATAGEMVAEASFFSAVYHCRAVADQTTECFYIDRDRALERILNSADTSRDVLRLFAQQIRDLRGLHEIRNIRSADARVLAYLKSQADEAGCIMLSMSLRDMAYKLGLAHETLYRSLRNLQDSGDLTRPQSGQFILSA